ncbi:spondin [Holotrichia oblita]|uniref:Spondin n=1 Tax=Holotrichia oblita TaxID=644536 RepID=A0ACB9T6R9_HOLOL|nr:spondin [Holotrichia oblita]
MKPLARLILSRQRLYEKHNCEGPESKVLPDLEEYCAVTEWQDWSPCNVDCGRGTRHRQRTYKLKVVDQHKQRETCKKTLTQRSSCYGVKPECPQDGPPAEECELTQWGKWSECSVTCGNGTKTRSRRYRTRAAAKHCQQVTNNPPRLEQNLPCSLPPCDWIDAIPPECVDRAWSEWSTCSVTCGKGTKMRRKLTINTEDLNRHNRISRSYDEESEEDIFGESEDECENVIERVECYNDEAPSCDESTTIPALACSLAVDVGLCRSNVDRWHFNSIKGKCELFSYSGCEGNKNNFRTLEMCEHICGNYQSMMIAIGRFDLDD